MSKGLSRTLCIISIMIAAACLTGCSNKKTDEKRKVSVVTTIFPEYDWTRQIVGNCENVDVKLLMKNGVDLHNFTPTADDIIRISTCDILIYVGGESDGWIQDALRNKKNKDLVEINLMKVLGDTVKEEEIVEGMEDEHHHEHGHEEDEHEDEHEHEHEDCEIEYDEHVWLSLRNAEKVCERIALELGRLAPENSETFNENLASYKNQLKDLDAEFASACKNIPSSTMIFCDRFPFRYFTEDYGINYFAAFTGCSAESEASFETIAFLAKKIDGLNAPKVYVLEKSDGKIAKTVISNTKAKNAAIVALDSMQSTNTDDIKNGKTYISTMKKNLECLR